MLNYLKAELYKVLRQRSFCVSLSLLLFCEGLLLVLMVKLTGSGWSVNRSVAFLRDILPFGFFLIYPLCGLIFSEQYKHGTLKNEVTFGLPRLRIYLGKLLAAVIVCIFVCVMAVAFFPGASWLFFPPAPGAELTMELTILGDCLLTALPVWLGALGLLHMLQVTIKSATLPTILYIAYFLAFEPMVSMLTELNEPFQNSFFPSLRQGLLSTPLENLSGYLGPGHMGWAWLVGMGWLVVTTIIGLVVFRRSDIK